MIASSSVHINPQRRPRRSWRIARRISIGLVMVLGVCFAAGLIAKISLRSQYPAPGQRVDVGGYALHLSCVGTGSPTVILEGGQGALGLIWGNVQPAIAASTRVCSYDRAGYGWSDPSPLPRTALASVGELHTLLQNAKIAPPYILVGHAIGGVYTKVYAHRYPTEVIGMVLVDSAHERQNELLPPAYQQAMAAINRQTEKQLRLLKPLINLGVFALRPSWLGASAKLPANDRAAYNALLATSSTSMETSSAELKAIDASFSEVAALNITSIGTIPLIVLHRGMAEPLPASITLAPEVLAQAEAQAKQQQASLVTLSPQGQLITVEQSGHNIQLDQPAAVIGAIESVLRATQR